MSDLNAFLATLLNPGNGAGCHPADPAWVRGIRDRCTARGIPFFFKQWGGRTPKAGGRELDGLTWDQVPALAVGLGDDR
jgi:protein gp37